MRHAKIGAAIYAAQLIAASTVTANNIKVDFNFPPALPESERQVLKKNTGTATATVQFNVSWENSWRVTSGPSNFDAAWVFVKYHTGDLIWKTATLDISDAAHSVPATATLDVGKNDAGTRGLGAFIYRAAAGSGDVSYNNVKLVWNYGADGVTDTSLVTLDVHAIEMVYVPQGAFQLGDGVSRAGAAAIASLVTAATPAGTVPFNVTTAGPIVTGPTPAGSLTATGLAAGAYKAIPTTFPTGFAPYYLMKYEASQHQWAAFVNTTSKLPAITYTYFEFTANTIQNPVDFIEPLFGRQDFNSPDLAPHIYGYYVSPLPATGGVPLPLVPTRPIVQAKFPDRAFLSTEAGTLAYLDWSGLRPMTEFEFEKACRGPVAPVQGEYAWGTADVALQTYGTLILGQNALTEDGTPAEAPASNYNTQGGNAWTRATILTLTTGIPVFGPCRVGMFAKENYEPEVIVGLPTPPPNAPARIQSGSGYYGIMDLTGNVSELVAAWAFPLAAVTTIFSAEHGDGVLSATGLHNVPGWALTPAGATFYGLRGGSYAEQALPASQRSLLAAGSMTNPGIRGARTAPVITTP